MTRHLATLRITHRQASFEGSGALPRSLGSSGDELALRSAVDRGLDCTLSRPLESDRPTPLQSLKGGRVERPSVPCGSGQGLG
jgi:hypothetical protein